jgi:hypothetical protein
LREDSLDRPVRAFLPNNEKCGPPCCRGDCAWITGYPEVMPLNKLSTMWARSPLRGNRHEFVVGSAGVCREPRAQVGGESSGSCGAFDRRRYTLPTLKRGVEEASMRKRLALILQKLRSVRGGHATTIGAHRIRLQISASFTPNFSRNLQSGKSEVNSVEIKGCTFAYFTTQSTSRR